jgi:hypothetical protein
MTEDADRTLVPGVYTCPACGHQSMPDGPPDTETLQCTECQSLIAFGVAMPRVFVVPDETDRRFMRVTFETMVNGEKTTANYKLVRKFARAIGHNMVSV